MHKPFTIKCLVCFLSGFLTNVLLSQHNSIFIDTYFKDQLLNPLTSKSYQGTGFFPIFESDYDVNKVLRDSSKQYYRLTNILFKKHLFEIKGERYTLNISPIIDFRLGEDKNDTIQRTLFLNTRGIYIDGDLGSTLSFSTAIYENQGRFSSYETAFYKSVGEFYTNQASGTYSQQNAVIPGAARTKPFKIDGFDFAYATGNIVYRPCKSFFFSFGNTKHFIGDGYRSLLLSDNSVPAPYFRGIFKIAPHLEFNYLRMRLLNLIRRPMSTTVESFYQSKGYSVNYLAYKPIKGLSLSFFEGIIWSRGDSISSKKVHPLFYSPLPGTALALLSKKELNYLLGFNLSYLLHAKHRVYAQLAFENGKFRTPATQLGFRSFGLLMQRDLMFQIEYNHIPKGFYENDNPYLSYSHYNLPLATIRGSGYDELVLRLNYEWKRIYFSEKVVHFHMRSYRSLNWLPIGGSNVMVSGNITLNQLEMGYRFNRKMNLCFFGTWQVRSDRSQNSPLTNLVFVGLRTGIGNHYNDF